MYKKAIVMEIKAAYAIAMEEGGSIIRIKKKDGLAVGDSIYVLPEDLYQGQEACVDSSFHRFQRKIVPFPAIKKSSLVKIASIAAMLILCITLVIPQLTVTTYAQASFDGAGSIQLSLDRNLQIIKAVSPDQSVSDSILKSLRGKHINEAGETLRSACGFNDVLIGYALIGETGDASSLDRELRALFPPHSVTFVNGTSQDIENAEKESLSLGKYLTGQQDKSSSDEPENSVLETSEQDEDETEQETDTPEQDEDETEQDSDTPEQDKDKTEQDLDTPEQDKDKTEQDSDTPEQDKDKTKQDSDTPEQDKDKTEQDETERDSDASDSTDAPESEDRPESSPEDSESEPERSDSTEEEELSSSREENPSSDEDSDSEDNSGSEEEEE